LNFGLAILDWDSGTKAIQNSKNQSKTRQMGRTGLEPVAR